MCYLALLFVVLNLTCLSLARGAVGWSVLCDCDISGYALAVSIICVISLIRKETSPKDLFIYDGDTVSCYVLFLSSQKNQIPKMFEL